MPKVFYPRDTLQRYRKGFSKAQLWAELHWLKHQHRSLEGGVKKWRMSMDIGAIELILGLKRLRR